MQTKQKTYYLELTTTIQEPTTNKEPKSSNKKQITNGKCKIGKNKTK